MPRRQVRRSAAFLEQGRELFPAGGSAEGGAVFGPVVISACLMADGVVELASVIEDEGYWDLVADDPSD